ncbi:RagB/SusD family nutrient uptake outer membrane protein [Chitinophaga sp. YIM B06452]|uniref:RagB/SusD family nutrient uptake outer membrane protein n=1 Tax=Chitinophaga sp. YIM B06452 TaxID=3082158 RepID=UPI0031FE84F5
MKTTYCIINTIAIAILSFFFVGCGKEWMEVKVDQSQAVATTFEDYRAILDNEIFMYSPSLTEVAADYHLIAETNWQRVKNSAQGNAYTWSENVPYKNLTDWDIPYSCILHANLVLDGIERLYGKGNDLKVNQLKGEALFQRGKFHYYIAMTFAPPFTKSSSNQTLGIPLKLKSDIENPTIRSSAKETYDQLISDIKISENLLPDQSNYITRPTKIAAVGMLSRIYMAMEEYDSAFLYADRYLKINNELIDYNDIPPAQLFVGTNKEIGYFSLLLGASSITTYLLPASFYSEFDVNDLRKQVFFREGAGQYIFKGSYSNTTTDKFSGIATDEMILNRSECYARKNDINAAMNDLNSLIRTRYLKINGTSTFVDYVASNQTDALKIILKERKKQLLLRNVRWSDLRRLNRDSRFAESIIRSIGGNTYILEPNSYKYTFPIPVEIITQSGIEQNGGWKN